MDNVYAPRFDTAGTPQEADLDRQIEFEADRVRFVLDAFDLGGQAPELVRRFRERWDRPWLAFAAFHAAYPSFPVLLEAHATCRVPRRCSTADLLRPRAFDEQFFLRRYMSVHARGRGEAAGRPIALVFPFSGYRGGAVIRDGDLGTPGPRLVRDLPGSPCEDGSPCRVTVESFQTLITYLARGGWSPGAPLPAASCRGTQGYPVAPWMTRALGPGPARDVLAFLWWTLHDAAGDRRLVRGDGAERCVAIDHETLAERTGLSVHQVRRGIGALIAAGLATTRRRALAGRLVNHVRLDEPALAALA